MRKNKKGFLLFEVLLTVIILSVSIVVINQSLTSSLRSLVYSEDFSKALILLETQMFDLMRPGFVEAGKNQETKVEGNDDFSFEVKTSSVAGTHINRVNAAILWTSGNRKNKIPIETYLFNPPEEGSDAQP